MSRRLTLQVKDAQTLVLSGLDDFLSDILCRIPEAGAPHPDSDARLFPPLSAGREPEMDADWKEFVRPELESQFSWNRDVVAEDLKGLRSEGRRGITIEILQAHVPAWVHALNQARLSLVARHSVSEEALEEGSLVPGLEGLALFQIQFYGMLQEWMIEAGDSI